VSTDDDSFLVEVIIEDAGPSGSALDKWDEPCPTCEQEMWLRAIAARRTGAVYVVFCAGCGKSIQERWNLLP